MSDDTPIAKQRRGFAIMSRERQRAIASRGGQIAHQQGKAHEWTPDEARIAGRKGGAASSIASYRRRRGES